MAEPLFCDFNYIDVLQSDGYVVDYAVCTTYSLDMPTLMSVPFMLGTLTDLTDAAMRAPHLIMEAIHRSAGRFAVFCNAGCIAVPQAHSKVYALLEHSVVQVALPAKGGGFVNFHPKVWVVKETNQETGEVQIKVVVLSRNLTGSHDLDVMCSLVGKTGKAAATQEAQAKHAPLVHFLTWLEAQTHDRTIRKQTKAICAGINHVERFNLKGSPFDDYDFFPMGIDGHEGYAECLEGHMLSHAAEMLVISPFVDRSVLQKMAGCSPACKKTLITRHASVTPEILSMFNDGVYVPKEVLTDKVEKDVAVDLHEKVYFVRRHEGNLSYNHLYLGSTNATTNGFRRNVEFLLHLRFAPNKWSYDRLRSELINNSKECMFEPVESVPTEDTPQERATDELTLRTAIAALQKAQIDKTGDHYAVTIHCLQNKLPKETIRLYPLGCEAQEAPLTNGLNFGGLTLSMLTEFYVAKIGELRRVIKIATDGMPVEERNSAIFRSFINTKSKFINYLTFMLTDDVEQCILESQQIEKELLGDKASAIEQPISASLYEDMVRMAYTHPDRIVSIRQIIEKADKDVVPDHFLEMVAAFEKAIKQTKRL